MLLLTDGQTNTGITEPAQIRQIVGQGLKSRRRFGLFLSKTAPSGRRPDWNGSSMCFMSGCSGLNGMRCRRIVASMRLFTEPKISG